MGEEEIKQKYLQLQMTAQNVREIQQQLEAVERKGKELEANIDSIADLKGRKSAEMLSPISEGIFLKAQLKDERHLVVNVGAGVCVRKSAEEVRRMLQERKLELSQYAARMRKQAERGEEMMKKLELELSSMVQNV
ncbi:prefoldin subunit alpha [Candidatus Woesearchaeota archaeon]|nr:prefoldin subunit alpha [Candidatus Woesearchaeota archaeon]